MSPGGSSFNSFGHQGPPPANQHSTRDRPLAISVAVASVLVLAAASLVIVLAARGDTHSGSRSQIPQPSASIGEQTTPRSVANAKVDPKSLSVRELFPSKTLSATGHSYNIRKTQFLNSCVGATIGSVVAKALATYQCREVVRATIIDASSTYVGTIAVANLADAAGAAELNDLLKDPHSNGVFFTLDADGITFNPNQGKLTDHTSYGHFVVVSIVTKTDPSQTSIGQSEPGAEDFMHDSEAYLVRQLRQRTQQ